MQIEYTDIKKQFTILPNEVWKNVQSKYIGIRKILSLIHIGLSKCIIDNAD